MPNQLKMTLKMTRAKNSLTGKRPASSFSLHAGRLARVVLPRGMRNF